MSNRPHLMLAVCVLLATSVQAEQMYVSDKLVANITDQASQDGKKVTTVETGDVLEVLARADGYVHVRTEKGNEGWIKSNYVTAQMPAARRLKELEATQSTSSDTLNTSNANVAKYTQEIAQLQERNKALDTELVAAKQAADEARAVAAATAAQVTTSAISAEVTTSVSTVDSATPSTTTPSGRWSPTVIAMVVATYLAVGIFGFVWGYRTLSAKIRRKYGRVKIL